MRAAAAARQSSERRNSDGDERATDERATDNRRRGQRLWRERGGESVVRRFPGRRSTRGSIASRSPSGAAFPGPEEHAVADCDAGRRLPVRPEPAAIVTPLRRSPWPTEPKIARW